jgi:hypothetical protein
MVPPRARSFRLRDPRPLPGASRPAEPASGLDVAGLTRVSGVG